MNPLDWAGLVLALAVIAVYALAVAIRALCRRRYKVRELADLDRGDIDPDWEQVRQTLGQPEK